MDVFKKDNKQIDFVLRELGITQWRLRYPIILNNKDPIKLWMGIRLLLVSSDYSVSLDDSFIKDVIRAMHLDYQEVYLLTVEQIKDLVVPEAFSCHCWWIGVKASSNFHGICLITPSLSILKSNIEAKRDLWRQIRCVKYNT